MEDTPFISVNAESLGSYAYTDFVYSVTLKRGDASAEVFRFAFGIDETLERYWSVTFDAKEGKITLGDANENALKTASFIFNKGATKRLRIVVNDGIAKVYAKEENAATLTLGLDGYEGGYVGEDLSDSHFEYHDPSLMSLDSLSGDIYVGGYDVLKVVNLTDGNRVLATDEFTLNQGLITIDPAYLDTLENDALYKFRVVTSFTDFDFYVQTDGELTSCLGKDWMKLFIGVHPKDQPAWEGFDFCVQRLHIDGDAVALEKSKGGFSWEHICDVPRKVGKRCIELSIPLEKLGITSGNFTVDFKWIDNAASDGDIQTCLSDGDSAPNGRYRYRYIHVAE